jgi:hypothetical protein
MKNQHVITKQITPHFTMAEIRSFASTESLLAEVQRRKKPIWKKVIDRAAEKIKCLEARQSQRPA